MFDPNAEFFASVDLFHADMNLAAAERLVTEAELRVIRTNEALGDLIGAML